MAEYFRDNGKHAVGRPQESDGEGVEESSRDVSEVAASPGWRRVFVGGTAASERPFRF